MGEEDNRLHCGRARPSLIGEKLARVQVEEVHTGTPVADEGLGPFANSRRVGGASRTSSRLPSWACRRQAIEFCEPVRILVATQSGAQFGNDVRNVGSGFGVGDTRIDRVEIDAFGEDHGYGVLRERVEHLCEGTQCRPLFIRTEAVGHCAVRATARVSGDGVGIHWVQGVQPGILARSG